MDSRRLDWQWCIETLAECEGINVALLKTLILLDPEFDASAPKIVREKVALKFLEDLVGFNQGKKPSGPSAGDENYNVCSVEDVLCRQARKFLQASQWSDGERGGSNLLSDELLKFILEKRESLPKSPCFNLEYMLRGKIQWDPDSNSAKKLKFSNDCEVQPSLQSSGAIKPQNGIRMMQTVPFKTMQGLLNLAYSNRSNLLQVDEICSHHVSNRDAGNEMNIVNVSNKDCMTSPGRSPTVPLDDCTTKVSQDHHSCSLEHMKNNDKIGKDDPISTFCRVEHLLKKSSVHQSSCDRNSTQPIKGSSPCHVINTDDLREDSSRHGCCVPNQIMPNAIAMDLPNKGIDRSSDGNLIANISLAQHKDGTSEDIFIVENVKNLNPGLHDTHCGSISMQGMHGEHEESINLECGDAVSSSEKYQPGNYDSVNETWTEQGLCMKCGEAGALLTCNRKGCSVAAHEGCLGSSAVFNKSGLFYCPFCLFKKATSALHKAQKEFKLAQDALSAFAGKICATSHEGMLPHPRVDQQTVVMNDVLKVKSNYQPKSVSCAGPSILNANNPAMSRKSIAVGEHQRHVDSCMAKDRNSLDQDDQCNPRENCENIATEILDDVATVQYSEHEKQHKSAPKDKKEKNDSTGIQLNESVEAHAQVTRTLHPISVNKETNSASSSDGRKIGGKIRVKRYSNPLAHLGRRNNLVWSAEEEEMLKEGFNRFVKNQNETIPWAQILDFGRDVFHKTRQPGDLKDKWRNMKKKSA